jgi:hypothetical protein
MSMRLTTAQFADLVEISHQKARRAFARALEGKPWRGATLIVDPVSGRGGVAGQSYVVRVSSLPPEFQQRLKDTLRPAVPALLAELTPQRGAERDWYLRMLGPLLGMENGRERRAAIDALTARTDLTDWRGRPASLTVRTIERRLQQYRERGPLAFAPRARADKGKAKVIISLAAEQAVPFDTETWENIAADLRDYIRGHWKDGATLGLVEGRANIKFRELVAAAGFSYFHTLPEKTFIVPRRFVVAERHYRHVHTLYRDRKSYEDNRFRTIRSRSHLMPMDWVIFDVHPVDIVMTRDDGSEAHTRMIAFLDGATNRMRFKLILCEPGTGVRNAHMIEAFCEMLADPTWGMPKTLYLDNGQENNFADKLHDALQLVEQLRGSDGSNTRVKRAMPYNASAKPIEGMFAKLEKNLQDIPGHTGGDRLNKKTERVGRPTKAFAGTVAELTTIIQGRILEMESRPARGHQAGRSSVQIYTAAVEAGWQPVAVDVGEVLTVFAADRDCKINKGVITFQNRNWACPEMASYFQDRIIARVPLYWPADRLALLHVKTRELVGIATPIGAYAFDDPQGAVLSKKIDKARRDAIRELDRSAPSIDTVQEGLRLTDFLPRAPVAAPIARIGISTEAATIAGSLAETPAARADRQREKNLKAQRRQSEALDRALRGLKGK